jgi:hypothetical protein
LQKCYKALKDEILLAGVASLYEDETTFYITVNGESLAAKDVKKLAIELSENPAIRGELSSYLGLETPLDDGFYSDYPDIVNWYHIVKEVILILEACSVHALGKEEYDIKYDIEFATFEMMEKSNYQDGEWINFYKHIVCQELSYKGLTTCVGKIDVLE